MGNGVLGVVPALAAASWSTQLLHCSVAISFPGLDFASANLAFSGPCFRCSLAFPLAGFALSFAGLPLPFANLALPSAATACLHRSVPIAFACLAAACPSRHRDDVQRKGR